MKIKKGDSVVVIAGKFKGQSGTVATTIPTKNQIVIEGMNVVKVHKKQSASVKNPGVYEKAMPIDVSNVGFAHPSKKGKSTRVGFSADKSGKKTRILKANGKEIK